MEKVQHQVCSKCHTSWNGIESEKENGIQDIDNKGMIICPHCGISMITKDNFINKEVQNWQEK
jgi:hypothetical protein